MKRHIIDPTFFDDILIDCGDWYKLHSRQRASINEYGEVINEWKTYKILGSLQPQINSKNEKNKASYIEQNWNFYCGSEYKIYIDDLIETEDGEFLLINEYTPWDSHGVRELKCKSINSSELRNLKEFEEYYEGLKTK